MRSVSHVLTTYRAAAGISLALPLGELSPKVTERAFPRQCLYLSTMLENHLTKRIVAYALRFLCSCNLPRSHDLPLALPLGELSPKVTERAFHPPMYVFVRTVNKTNRRVCPPFPMFSRHTESAAPTALPGGEPRPSQSAALPALPEGEPSALSVGCADSSPRGRAKVRA